MLSKLQLPAATRCLVMAFNSFQPFFRERERKGSGIEFRMNRMPLSQTEWVWIDLRSQWSSGPPADCRCAPLHGCQMAIAKFLDCICLALQAGRTMDTPLRYAPKFDLFLSLDCAGVEGMRAHGSNLAIWQPCSLHSFFPVANFRKVHMVACIHAPSLLLRLMSLPAALPSKLLSSCCCGSGTRDVGASSSSWKEKLAKSWPPIHSILYFGFSFWLNSTLFNLHIRTSFVLKIENRPQKH